MATNADFTNMGADAFMDRYPLLPEGNDNALQSAHGTYCHVPKDKRVSYMEISPGTHYSLANFTLLNPTPTAPNREGNPQKAICFQSDNPGHTRIPVFWLPYRQNSNYRMTLEPNVGDPQPNFFLTACVDGCSVYVEGTRAKPTVHHVNAADIKFDPGDGTAPYGTTGDFAKDTNAFHAKDVHMTNDVDNSRKPKTVNNNVVGLQQAKYVKNDDYMLRDPVLLQQQKALMTTNARSVVSPKAVDKADLMTQGTVFGIRDTGTGEWTFYFQRRLVAVLYHDKNRWWPLSQSDWELIGYRMYPILIQEFWPNGGGNLFVRT